MAGRRSYVARAALAVGLFFGFYALALGIAGLLVWIPYAEWVYAERIHIRLTFGALVGAGAILKGTIFVPAPRFEAPGPEYLERARSNQAALGTVRSESRTK